MPTERRVDLALQRFRSPWPPLGEACTAELMDLLFGTYRCPDHELASVGIKEPIAKSYLGRMLHPFLPGRKALAPLRDTSAQRNRKVTVVG